MFIKSVLLAAVLFIGGVPGACDASQEFKSRSSRAQLIELFTSQGCSSCPPAEAWFNQLAAREDLWQSIVPVAWHVDYWDGLGWKDPFADKSFTDRQRSYRQKGRLESVYTPCFMVDGQEWRGWFERTPLPEIKVPAPGILQGSIKEGVLGVSYTPEERGLIFTYVLMGFGEVTHVTQGENSRRKLKSDFVVLATDSRQTSHSQWSVALPPQSAFKTTRLGLAVWVQKSGQATPLQATGCWLSENSLRE